MFTPSRTPQEGRCASSRNVGRGMRWTWAGVRWQHRRDIGSRTAKSCGPGAATVASIRSACAGLATVTINAAHRGEHEGNRNTIARGKAGIVWLDSWWFTGGLVFVAPGLRVRLAPGFPCALSSGRDDELNSSDENQVARIISTVIAGRDRAIQYSRDVRD
jgi:hypothetical protein